MENNAQSGEGKIALIGIPFDEHASFMQGASEAPQVIRETLHNGSANYFSELGIDITKEGRLEDKGDLDFRDYFDITRKVIPILTQGYRLLSLGGDHSVTFPLLRAFSNHHEPPTILQIDAHGDLYHEFEGNRYSHACPFARIMEERLAKRLIQVGVRSLNDHQRKQAERFGVEIYEMKDLEFPLDLSLEGTLYISLDLDGLDPAFAPGVSHHEPGGLSTRQVLQLIQSINVPLLGADIVELNPSRDVSGVTAMLAAKFLREIAGKMITQLEEAAIN